MFWYLVGMADPRSLSERLSKLPPGRHLVPRDFVAQNQRERMLLATAELVAERGYQKTTIELIAKTARVALVTFYEQFSSKEECFLAAFDESVAAAAEVFAELLDPEQPWARADLRRARDLPRDGRQRAGAGASSASSRPRPPAERRWPATRRCWRGGAEAARGARVHNPRASRLPDGLEVAIAGGLVWLVHQRLVADEVDDLKGLLPEMLQVTLTPYVGEVEAGRAADAAQARAAA